MSTSVTIKPLSREDLPHAVTLLSELNREEGYTHSADLAAITSAMNDPRITMQGLLALQGEKVVGLALYYWGYDTVSATYGYHLADIVVTSAARGRGIGSRLFAAVASECLAAKGQWMSLTALKKNTRVHTFYLRHGMVEVDVNFYAIGPTALRACTQRAGN